MIVVDANVVIAASAPTHPHHAAAQRIVAEHGGDGMVLHPLTMAEVLVGPARAGVEVRARRLLEEAGFSVAAGGGPEPEVLARVRAAASLKMPDACVLATAEQLAAPLATFDQRLAREARVRQVAVLGLATPSASEGS
ncbi:type II toxin-antitoxin system VapC family toxin [Luteimicrobium sp. NPDC057192]|uniref:type II toxin-antitoxin system VapC family toxin n=1 Tax=Luteimicrobium sp. NPDC057192 TaxID=3346042 RepID=UPI003641E3B8